MYVYYTLQLEERGHVSGSSSSTSIAKKDDKLFLKVAGGLAVLGVVVLIIVLPVYYKVIG